jgi:hypothetical protein
VNEKFRSLDEGGTKENHRHFYPGDGCIMSLLFLLGLSSGFVVCVSRSN